LSEFLVSPDGSRIDFRPLSGGSKEALHSYLLSQVLSFSLLKFGIEPIHSTAVVIDGEAVCFLGFPGLGKSTTAAAFVAAGYPLLTDDILVLQQDQQRFLACPGTPRIKLFPQVAKRLLGDRAKGIPMNQLTSKLIISLRGRSYCRRAVPLRGIYVLAPRAASLRNKRIIIRRLSERQIFLHLVRNTYNRLIIDPRRLKQQFRMAAEIASQVPCRLLSYPRSLSSLDDVRQAVLRDITKMKS
jgi:hypothetical protein